MQKEIVGILLAGGLSRRFGSPKAFAEIDGKKYYEISYHILEEISNEVIIVTRPELMHKFPENKRVITDEKRFSGCGPLAGIYSAMKEQLASRYIVLPCDMPLLTKEIVKRLLALHVKEVTIPVVEDKLQPLVSVWNYSMLEKIETVLKRKRYKMTEALKKAEVSYIDIKVLTETPNAFLNINSPEDEKEAKRWKVNLS